MKTIIRANDVSVFRSRRALVKSANISLHAGECVALLGPNGAGKSTLLRVLAGDIRADVGEVIFHEKPLHRWSEKKRATVRAVMPQQSQIPFAFAAREVVELGRYPHCAGALAKHDRGVVSEALALMNVSDLAARDVTQLSGGERARVHIARVLAQVWEPNDDYPPLLLLDEPTAALDLKHQGHTLSALRTFARTHNAAVLAVLHDVNLAAQWADQLVWMRAGEIVASGSPHSTMKTQLLRDVYEVSASITTRDVTMRDQNGSVVTTATPHAMIEWIE
jgi:iron complex transport system ATP-binding protein